MIERHRRGGVLQDVRTLFDSGTTVGLTDGELLGRFADRPDGDDAAGPAFAALVERHGPMVLRVCRSILRDEHDAQDAFQATFLVLVRRANSVHRQASVGSWLHGIALRVSARARVEMARRRRHERRSVEARGPAGRTAEGGIAPEAAGILHEELGRLPERYRAAVVLCYLEGHTCEAAARRLGWPVGTVKSRLARGRDRLRRRLIRRGLAPDETSGQAEDVPTGRPVGCSPSTGPAPACETVLGEHPTGKPPDLLSGSPPPAVVIPAALARTTAEAMLRFAAGRPIAGAVSPTALCLTVQTLRRMQMTRLALFSALLIAGLAATGAAMFVARGGAPAPARQAAPARMAVPKAEPAADGKKTEVVTVQVVDPGGQGVPGVEVEVLERFLDHEGPRYRTGAGGRVRIPLDPRADPSYGTRFMAHPDDRTLGWAYLARPGERKDQATDAIRLSLIPLTHEVEGSVVDRAGRAIPGVRIHAASVEQANGPTMIDYLFGPKDSRIGSAVTDAAGRYAIRLPDRSSARLVALHPRYAGPSIICGADERTIPPVRLEDAGGIAGMLLDSTAGRPVEGAKVHAAWIEAYGSQLVGAGWAISDAQGRYRIGGLPPGVYNLYLDASPLGRRFPARAIEGVRIEAGADAAADLKQVEGRRIQGKVVHFKTGKPMSGASILCSNPSLPSSGHAGETAITDDQGCFAFFVPPGLTCVYLQGSTPYADKGPDTRTLIVAADRDPEPLKLEGGCDPNDLSARPVFAPGGQAQFRQTARAAEGALNDRDSILEGRIVDQDGSPIAGVHVVYNHDGLTKTYATDRRGEFRVKGLPTKTFFMDLIKKGYRGTTAHIPPEARGVEIVLPKIPDSSY